MSDLLTWTSLRPVLRKAFGHCPSYERFMRLVDKLKIPYEANHMMCRGGSPNRRYDPEAVIAAFRAGGLITTHNSPVKIRAKK